MDCISFNFRFNSTLFALISLSVLCQFCARLVNQTINDNVASTINGNNPTINNQQSAIGNPIISHQPNDQQSIINNQHSAVDQPISRRQLAEPSSSLNSTIKLPAIAAELGHVTEISK
jgi:hypothetical protein